MVKEFLIGVTPGIESYIKDGAIRPGDLQAIVETAVQHAEKSYFIAFQKSMLSTLVTDGNDHILDELVLLIPEDLWVVCQESDTEVAYIAMLPREY